MSKNRKKKKKQPQTPQKQEISRRNFLGLTGKILGAITVIAGIGSIAYITLPKKHQKLEQMAEVGFDSFTETIVKNEFARLSYKDEKTIDFFADSVDKYYDKLDEIIKNKKQITYNQAYTSCEKMVLNPLCKQIKNFNPVLDNFIDKKKYNKMSQKNIKELLDIFNEYFEKNGFSFLGLAPHTKHGQFIEFRGLKAEKETNLKGNICGNEVTTNTWYCNWPLKIMQYSTRKYNGVPGATQDSKRIYIFQGSERATLDLLEDCQYKPPKKNIKTFGDLGNVLFYKGLKKYIDDSSKKPELLKEISRIEKLHELAHVLYEQKQNKKVTTMEQMQVSELFAWLASIKNNKDQLVYHTLGSVISAKPEVYIPARHNILDFYRKEMLANRKMYPNVDFSSWDKTHIDLNIMKEIANLTVPQTRYIADKALKKFFPGICK